MRHFLFLLASARHGGNTEAMARFAAEHLPEGATQQWLRLSDLPLDPFQDIRHSGDGVYPAPEGNAKLLLEATVEATDIVIASPVYWYSIAAPAKLYLDHWSAWLRVPGVRFRDRMQGKTMWSVTALSNESPEAVAPLVDSLKLTADYMDMRWGGSLINYYNRPGEAISDGATNTFFSGVRV
ncbi:flavodoxin family protein [Longispora urticae]